MKCGVLYRLQTGLPGMWWNFAVALFAITTALHAQVPTKPPRNIFDDDPTPPPGMTTPKTARPAAPVVAPAEGLAPGFISAMYEGATTDAPLHQNHITPTIGISFDYPATPDFIPMSFTFKGFIDIPTGGAVGIFHFETTGDSEFTVDGQLVTSIHHGDIAGTFEHPVNLKPGLHPITAKAFNLHGTGARQRVTLGWKPTTNFSRQLPKEWCWHAKADEPAGIVEIPKEGQAPPPGQQQIPAAPATITWVRSGTPRPQDPSARPDDVLGGIILASFGGPNLEPLNYFGIVPTPSCNMTVNPNLVDPNLGYRESVKFIGTVKVDNECQAAFDCTGPGSVTIKVDEQLVTRTGNPAEQPLRQAITLKPGHHAFEVAIFKITATSGVHSLALKWQVNNGNGFSVLPPGTFAHLRRQELYADSVAGGGTGQQPFSQPGQQTAAAPAPRQVRLPIPDADAQAKATAVLRQRFAAGWVEPGTAQQADYLIKATDQTREDAVATFVLLQQAYQQGQAGNSLLVAYQAIDLLASQFSVDAMRLKLTVLQSLITRRPPDMIDSAAAIRIANQGMQEDNYAMACDATAVALAIAHQINSPQLIAAAELLGGRATAARAEFEKVKPMLARLAANSSDGEANLGVGRFYCFTARNWQKGSAALALGSDPTLAWLGKHELTALHGGAGQTILADGWWDAADGQPDAVAAIMRERAAQWYRVSAPTVTGLSRRVAEKRFAKIPSSAILGPPFAIPMTADAATTVANNGQATPTQIPGSPPRPVGGVQTNGFKSPNNPGPLVVIIDPAATTEFNHIVPIAITIGFEIKMMEPSSQVTIIVATATPQVLHFNAGEYTANPGSQAQLNNALRAPPGAGNIDNAIVAGFKEKPARLMICGDTQLPLDHLATIVNQQDPDHAVFRHIRLYLPQEDRQTSTERMRTVNKLFGLKSSVGMQFDPAKH